MSEPSDAAVIVDSVVDLMLLGDKAGAMKLVRACLAARGDEERERAAKVVEARGKKVGGAIDPALTAAAIRDGGRDGK